MKNTLKAVLVTTAVSVSVMPTAFADTTPPAKDFTIDVSGSELPVSLGALDYPYVAADRGISGECDVEVELAPTGDVSSFAVQACSNAAFERAAEDFARTLSYDAETAGTTQKLTVSWQTAE